MLVTGTFFWQVVLAIHIIVVVGAFGLLVSYPILAAGAERIDRRSVPSILRTRVILGRTLVNPGLVLVVVAGIYLAGHLHQWSQFYVQWGIGAAVVIGALEGMFILRRMPQLADLAQRDIDASTSPEISWSTDYLNARTRLDQVNVVLALLVVVTVYFMSVGS